VVRLPIMRVLPRSISFFAKSFLLSHLFLFAVHGDPQYENCLFDTTSKKVDQLERQQNLSGALTVAENDLARAKQMKVKGLCLRHYMQLTANLYAKMGHPEKALPLLIEEISQLQQDGPSEELVEDLQSLALTFGNEGLKAESVNAMRAAITTYEGLPTRDPLRLIRLQNNLGLQCMSAGLTPMALGAFNKALSLEGPAESSVIRHEKAFTLEQLSLLYTTTGDRKKADESLTSLRQIHDQDAKATVDWEIVSTKVQEYRLFEEGRFLEAAGLDEQLISQLRSRFGANSVVLIPNLTRLATVYYAARSVDRANTAFRESFSILRGIFDARFPYMDEGERIEYLSTLNDQFATFYSFVYTFHKDRPALVEEMYQLLLWQKSAVARSLRELKAHLQLTGNNEINAQLDELSTIRSKIVAQERLEPSNSEIMSLQARADSLDHSITQKLNELGLRPQLPVVSTEDVRRTLKPGELAIEVVRFPFNDGTGWTRTWYYAAIVLPPQQKLPLQFVDLGEAKKLEIEGSAFLAEVQERTPELEQDRKTIELAAEFCKQLEPIFESASRVYVSPDGILSQVPWAPVKDSKGKMLIDEPYDIRFVMSTGDLVTNGLQQSSNRKTASLFGNPNFDSAPTVASGNTDNCSELDQSSELSSTAIAKLGIRAKQLPGTGEEVKQIATTLRAQGWTVQCFTGANASKQALMRVSHPAVLHIATHGFFIPSALWLESGDRRSIENALVHSGLLLAGANRTFEEQRGADVESGVLTAYEASGIDLVGTQLVVLSACDTGLGDVVTGGEVFGLRRSLQIAGARSILMSMWPVPDRKTQLLMQYLYAEWAKTNDLHLALKHAQLKLRNERSEPLPSYFWAAFVLYGP